MTKQTLFASALVLASSATALADLDLYITGATAYRKVLFDTLNGTCVFSSAPSKNPGASDGSSQYTFQGPVTGLGTVTVYCSFSGSVKGCEALKNGTDITNFKTIGGSSFTADANLSFADNQLQNMPFDTSGLSSVEVGVLPFVWVRNAGADTDILNVSQKIIPTLFTSAAVDMHMITGDPTDVSVVGIAGRGWSSGTRIITAAETGFGVTSTATFVCLNSGNWEVADGSNTGVTGDNNAYGYGYGYESGSTLKTALTTTGTGVSVIGMMSVGEAQSTSGGGAIPAGVTGGGAAMRLKHQGVEYTRDAVRSGQYTFWSYERLAYKTTDYTGNFKTFVDNLVGCLDSQANSVAYLVDDAPVIAKSAMAVERPNDGAPVADKVSGGF
jgi:hypothetical protein